MGNSVSKKDSIPLKLRICWWAIILVFGYQVSWPDLIEPIQLLNLQFNTNNVFPTSSLHLKTTAHEAQNVVNKSTALYDDSLNRTAC